MSSYAVRAQLVATARALLSLGLNFSALDSKKNSKPWRVYGQLLLREIGYRHYIDPDQPNTKPYILYEQHLSSIPSHLLRFQNFMAERGIFRHLLSVDWLSRLTTAEYVNISSLLRRIRNEDNVYYSYRNRRDFVRRAGELDVQVQNEVLPIWDISEDTIPGAMLKSRLGLKAFPEALSRALKGIARGAGFVVLLPFIFLIAGALSLIFPFSKSINAWLARMKIGTLMQFDPNATELSALLAQYEAKFSGSAVHVEKMASMATRTEMIPKLISSGWIDHVPLQNRVFITSLFRRLLTNPKIAEQVGHEPVRSAISVLSQSNLPQLKIPNKYQTLERLLFKGVDKKAKSTAKVKPTTALKLKPRPPIPVENTSEQHVKSEGWFQVRGGQFTKFAEMVRNRHYSNAITMCDDANLLGTLEQADLSLLAALRAYHGIPTAVSSHLGRALKGNEKAALLLDRKVMRGEKREHASQLLFPNVGKTQSDLIRSLWVEAETLMQDDDDLAAIGVLEDIAIQYGNIPQNRITSRRISFDTFLITKLGDLLEKAKGWLDFHEENPTVLLAFAHCAVLAGDHDLTKILFGIIEHKTTIKPVFKLGLEEAYLGRGIHGLNTILAQGDLETLVQTPALTRIQDKEKTLCLVETSANVGNLNALKGLSDKVVCAPVQPNDASKFPALVQKLQIEDAIPMYSKEDMDISHEVDKLTEIAVAAVTDQFKDNEDTAQWADFVEVVHATTFFSIYREVMAMKLVEKLTADVKGYDRVVFLLKNGQSLSSFFNPIVKSIGAKNVYFSLENSRKSEFTDCLQAVRGDNNKDVPEKDKALTGWHNGFGVWMDQAQKHHKEEVAAIPSRPYALHMLEHINGYFDAYSNLIKENLAYSDVELMSAPAHTLLNDFVEGAEIKRYQKRYSLSHVRPRRQVPQTRGWAPMLSASIAQCFDGVKSPLFPQYKDMILGRIQNHISSRLAQILDLAAYFEARFEVQKPTHIFTGPNQHIASRSASILGKRLGVRVYDFLILANTNHPRYRPPIADAVYLYDGWYDDIYKNYFGFKPEQIRVSGPLFDYGKRLDRRSKTANKAKGRQHIVFFSQSANFDVNRMILEDLCKTAQGRDDIYITVKLHPHESPAHIGRYQAIADKFGRSKNISIWHKDADAIDLVNQADLVVQSFSNIGLDSFLLKKPVITVKFSGKPHARIFLYEKGIGKEVKTRAALRKAAKSFLDDPKAKAAIKKQAEKFAKDNQHFLQPDNAKRVLAEVIAENKKGRKRPK